MVDVKKLMCTTLFFIMMMCYTIYADSPVINTLPDKDDATTGPGVYFRYDANPKNVVPNNITDTGPLGKIYTHQGRRYIKGRNLGEFKLTGYCACTKCTNGTGITYSGKPVTPNHTIAADLSVIPLDTFVILEGTKGITANYYDGVYQVEDKGSAVKDKHIDIYQPNHRLAGDVTQYGYNYAEVYEAVPIDEEARQKEFMEKVEFLIKYQEEHKNDEQ